MKIAIVNVQAPFVRGGAEYLADSLAGKLQQRGHRVEVIRIPFKWYPAQTIAEHMLACQLMKLEGFGIDQVIALKFPAYLIPFENKKIWLLHQLRQVYDLWGTPYSGLPDNPQSHGLRNMIMKTDNATLTRAKKLFSNSRIVADRLQKFNQIQVDEILYPPLDQPELFQCGQYDSYLFYPSRLNTAKRQHIAIEAMRYVRSPVWLVLAGKADSEEYGNYLQQITEAWNLQDRVQFLGWISEEEKAKWMSNALAAIYLPFDEDSYGYVTLEAFHSHKLVLTFEDSGGTGEVVEDGRNGWILPSHAQALAEKIDQLYASQQTAKDMGHEAFQTLKRHRIEWDCVLDRLVA